MQRYITKQVGRKQGRQWTWFIYSELVRCSAWDTIANCKLQSGVTGEECLEGRGASPQRSQPEIGKVLLHLLLFGCCLDEVWECGAARISITLTCPGAGK